jgi:hypothetical protein
MKKFIGLVKWFHDKAKDANYGFIQHTHKGDLFFHENNIEKGQDINLFKENETVVFASKASEKHKDKLQAIQVRLLSTENDIHFLYDHFLSTLSQKGIYSDYNILQKAVYLRIQHLLEISEDIGVNKELFTSFKNFITKVFSSNQPPSLENIKGLSKVCKDFFPDKYIVYANFIEEQKISQEFKHELWLDDYLETCQVDYICSSVTKFTDEIQNKVFKRCSEKDIINIFFKLIFDLDDSEDNLNLKELKNILSLAQKHSGDQYEKIINEALKICPTHVKLNLWVDGYHQVLEFDDYKLFTITLSTSDQKKFVKKVLKYIHEQKVNITIEELTSLNLIDYHTSKLSESYFNTKLDYSTSIILNTIIELKNQTKLDTRKDIIAAKFRMFDIIINQINDPADILNISGYFDECDGRISHPNRAKSHYKIAKHHPICDGRKFLDKNGEPVKDSEHDKEFWWCANQKCFEPSRKLHTSDQWEKYSLLDFLTILKVDFNQKDLETYLNIINKANRFFKHLKCRDCNHILRPTKQSNYAFYGVNHFNCVNENCKNNEEIYITHCLNGKCEQAIDSRDSVRCKPEGFEQEKCGWYVCTYCLSCCSDDVINTRRNITSQRGIKYSCHTKGHKNLGVISCDKCGDSMLENKSNKTKFKKSLEWFINNKETSPHIIKSGLTQKDKHWFRFSRSNLSQETFRKKINNLMLIGFNIPDYDSYNDVYLISEPNDYVKHNSDLLVCSSCDNIVDLSNDFERANAINYFHKEYFEHEKIKSSI